MRSASLLALLLASACSLAPRYRRPEPPVAAEFPAAGAATPAPGAAAAVPADQLGWRDVLADDRLQALVALSLQNNRDLRVAALNVELTRAQYRIERSDLLPTVGATGSFTRGRTPADLSSSGRAVTASAWSVGAGITSFELDLFGRVRSLTQAALEQYLATDEARRSAYLSLVAEVATQDLALRAFTEQVTLARGTLETVQTSYDLTRRTTEAGRTSELDLRTAEAQLETARANVAIAERQRAQAENALVLLVGGPLPSTLPAAPPLDARAVVADLAPGVPSDVLLRRPDVLAAEHALLSANADIGAARAAFFPSITLTASAGTASSELSGLFGSGSYVWSFAPRINLPIFTAGRLRASLDVAEVRKDIQVARYERAIQAAFRDVADALVAKGSLDEQLRSQEARVTSEQRRYQLSELRYRAGVDSYLTLLTAQRDLFAAQQLLIDTRRARLVNLVQLYKALGGGWTERSAAVAKAGG